MPDKSELWLPPSYKPNRSPRRIGKVFTAVYRWTGLPSKTLWDIFQLLGVLAIPVVVVIASGLINDQQHQTDIQIAADQQRETALQNYLDTISGLILNSKLLQSQKGDPVRELALVQTLTTLRRLNPDRKVILLRFLYGANLIGGEDVSFNTVPTIVPLSGADLSGVDLRGAFLESVDLGGVDLRGADLRGADLRSAFLFSTNLSGADLSNALLFSAVLRYAHLSHAHLSGAELNDAHLNGADLSGADLSYAHLRGADLSNADLSGAVLIQQQLDQVYSCINATLPSGLICRHTP